MQILGCSSDASTNWLIPSVPETQDELLAADFGSEIPVGKSHHPHLSLKYIIINNYKPRKQASRVCLHLCPMWSFLSAWAGAWVGECPGFGWWTTSENNVASERAAAHDLSLLWLHVTKPSGEGDIPENTWCRIQALREERDTQGSRHRLGNKCVLPLSLWWQTEPAANDA